MEQQHYFPPLHGAVDCEKCEVRDCWCRGKFQRNRRDMPHTSGRCPRLPDLCGFVEKEERELYKATFMLVHAEYTEITAAFPTKIVLYYGSIFLAGPAGGIIVSTRPIQPVQFGVPPFFL